MTVAAPSRPPDAPRELDPIDRHELEALVEALIEEARRRARRRRRIYASVVVVVVLVGAAAFAIFGRAAQSQRSLSSTQRALAVRGADGPRIGFVRWTDPGPTELDPGPAELWVMNPDGSGQRLVTRTTGAYWTPDGRRITVWRKGALYVMNADGRNERRLGAIRAAHRGGTLSPDGRRIAFVRERAGNVDVYVMNADGSGRRRLTTSPGLDADPTWSPDGRRLLFLSGRDGKPETPLTARHDGNFELYVVNADGSGERRLTTSTADESWAVWSPDGRRIAFVRSGPGCSTSCQRLYLMNADGSRQRALTHGNDHAPSWSPDGRRIAFVRGWLDVGSHVESNLYVVGADGSNLRSIPNARSGPEPPAWSPEGSKIAFTRDDGVRNKAFPGGYPFTRNHEIYVVNADGSGLRNLTRRPGGDVSPIWLRR